MSKMVMAGLGHGEERLPHFQEPLGGKLTSVEGCWLSHLNVGGQR